MKKQNLLISPLVIISLLIVFISSCEKEEENPTNSFTDPRDGNVYKIVTIGDQVWMAENLKYLPSVVGIATSSETTPCYYVYDYNDTSVTEAKNTTNYITYGVLYNWEAAKAACPEGWHLPSDEEWTQLTDYLGGDTIAGGKLKETDTTHWKSPNIDATNESGFNALPGGVCITNHKFDDIGREAAWWSSTERETTSVYYRLIFSFSGEMLRFGNYKHYAYSVRCIKD